MNRYEVKKDTTNKNYGIYDSLSADFCMHNLGAIGENRYCFDIGITSTEGKKYEFERTLGDYLFDLNISKENNRLVLTINYVDREDNEDINMFQYDSIISIIDEGFKYIDANKDLVIILPGILFKDKMDKIIDTDDKNFVNIIKSVIIELVDNRNKMDIKEDTKEEKNKVFRLLPFKKK